MILLTNIKKYSAIYYYLFRSSLIADLEFRMNFVTRIFVDIIWYLGQIFAMEVLFLHIDKLGHWDRDQVRVFLGVLFVVDAIYMITLHDNLHRVSEQVRKGGLDMILTKPVSSQFLLSFYRASPGLLGNFSIACAWLGFSVFTLDYSLPMFSYAMFVVMLLFGYLALYSFQFMFATLAVIFTSAENLQYLFYSMYRLGMRPDSIYGNFTRYVLMSVVPLALIASLPARVLLDPWNWQTFLLGCSLSIFHLYLSTRFWRYALRFYSSASS